MAKSKKWRIRITVPGEPYSKSNTYKCFRGKVVIPAYVRRYEAFIKECARYAMQKTRKRCTYQFIKARIIYYLGSLRRKDVQNLPKTSFDALNEIVYDDDDQVHKFSVEKRYDKENPRTVITIETMENKYWPVKASRKPKKKKPKKKKKKSKGKRRTTKRKKKANTKGK